MSKLPEDKNDTRKHVHMPTIANLNAHSPRETKMLKNLYRTLVHHDSKEKVPQLKYGISAMIMLSISTISKCTIHLWGIHNSNYSVVTDRLLPSSNLLLLAVFFMTQFCVTWLHHIGTGKCFTFIHLAHESRHLLLAFNVNKGLARALKCHFHIKTFIFLSECLFKRACCWVSRSFTIK